VSSLRFGNIFGGEEMKKKRYVVFYDDRNASNGYDKTVEKACSPLEAARAAFLGSDGGDGSWSQHESPDLMTGKTILDSLRDKHLYDGIFYVQYIGKKEWGTYNSIYFEAPETGVKKFSFNDLLKDYVEQIVGKVALEKLLSGKVADSVIIERLESWAYDRWCDESRQGKNWKHRFENLKRE